MAGVTPRSYLALCALLITSRAVFGQDTLEAPVAASGVEVELVEQGAAPQEVIRFRPDKGSSGTVVMDMKIEQSMEVGGNQLPAAKLPGQRFTIAYNVSDVSPSGDIEFEYEYTKVEIVDDPDNPSPIAAQIGQMSKPLEGAKGTAVVTSRGLTKSADLEVPPGVSPQLRALLDGMKQSMERLCLPMPEEPIGVGGKWTVSQDIAANGVSLQQTSTCELAGTDDDRYTIDIDITQKANEQQINAPGLPPGAKVTLQSLTSQGAGQLIITSASVFPEQSSMKIDSQTKINSTVGENSHSMVTNMKMEMTIKPATQAAADGQEAAD